MKIKNICMYVLYVHPSLFVYPSYILYVFSLPLILVFRAWNEHEADLRKKRHTPTRSVLGVWCIRGSLPREWGWGGNGRREAAAAESKKKTADKVARCQIDY